ncbi:MAG: hypothetical protein AB7K37_12280 [Cyclobacteriaceae bacterium]
MMVCRLILRDRISKAKWKTRNHSDDKKKDDYHREVKGQIISDLGPKIRKQFGDNCDIQLADGEIIVVSQKYDKQTGKKIKREKNTKISADKYFDKVVAFLLTTIRKRIQGDFTIAIHVERKEQEKVLILVVIYLEYE